MEKDMVKSIFRQREIEKKYMLTQRLAYWREYDMIVETRIGDGEIEDKIIGVYNVEIPMLEIGDKFFLDDIQEVVEIRDRMRSTDGSIVYYVKDKYIETEYSKKSYELCMEKIAFHKELQEYKKEYKYKHRFFNFRKGV